MEEGINPRPSRTEGKPPFVTRLPLGSLAFSHLKVGLARHTFSNQPNSPGRHR